jgi:hypothetical protein
MKISPKKRVELALNKKEIDKIPFTVYGSWWGGSKLSAQNPVIPLHCNLIPQCGAERILRNKGLCIIDQSYFGWTSITPNVKIKSTVYEDNKKLKVRTDYSTPVGNIYSIKEVLDFTLWVKSFLFKNKEDYRKILFLIKDTVILPDYDSVTKAMNKYGEDVFVRGDLGFEPMQELITGEIMGTENFAVEWMDNRDEVLKLYNAIVENRRKEYKILADSPLYYISYGGNIQIDLTSPENFKKYYLPHYEEAAEELHKKGKILGCHFDGNTKTIRDLISYTSLDVIEAFTPYPDTDTSIKEARKAWPDKILWVNFPSSMHLASEEKISEATRKIIKDAKSKNILIGVTEDVPQDRWQNSFLTIMDTIDKVFGVNYN